MSEGNPLAARLLAKRQIDPDTGCWLWQGRRDKWGYGRITVSHRRWSVHRLAAHLYLDLDPDSGLHVCTDAITRRAFALTISTLARTLTTFVTGCEVGEDGAPESRGPFGYAEVCFGGHRVSA
jgi:hypothetical protein